MDHWSFYSFFWINWPCCTKVDSQRNVLHYSLSQKTLQVLDFAYSTHQIFVAVESFKSHYSTAILMDKWMWFFLAFFICNLVTISLVIETNCIYTRNPPCWFYIKTKISAYLVGSSTWLLLFKEVISGNYITAAGAAADSIFMAN